MTNETERFLQHLRLELNHSQLTVAAYKGDLELFERFLASAGDFEAASVTSADVRAWLVNRSAHGDGARTLRRRVQAVRAFYKYLMQRGQATANPAADVELAKVPQRLPHVMRPRGMDAVLDVEVDADDFTEVRDHLVVMMLYATGIRRAELIGLLDRNVNTGSCEIKVHGKRDKERVVPFGDELRVWIERYRSLRDERVGTVENFFVTAGGGPLYPSLVYHVVHSRLAAVGGAGQYSPHVLRHSFASALLADGAGINSVKELLGHESLAATQVYTHVTLSELKHNYKLAHPRAIKKGG
ncbi:MAG: tyrosine-type recombinase/integrase [Muribaculaceae bacterium]|nr:tyrosine-type recombinase/integrase [Muribaculaceae bacterium]